MLYNRVILYRLLSKKYETDLAAEKKAKLDVNKELAALKEEKLAVDKELADLKATLPTPDNKVVVNEELLALKNDAEKQLAFEKEALTKSLAAEKAEKEALTKSLAAEKAEKEALKAKIDALDKSKPISVKPGVNPEKEDIIQLILFLSESRLEIDKLKTQIRTLESKTQIAPETTSITSAVSATKSGINMTEISRIIDAYKNIGPSGSNDSEKKESFVKLITEYKETYKLNTKIMAILESIKL